MAATKVDYLAEVLKQMQAKKTIKPDDAAKALTQYHKIQEQVRSLKEEIQLFKETQNKMVRIVWHFVVSFEKFTRPTQKEITNQFHV